MFTGIVTAVGRIVSVVPLPAGLRLLIDAADLGLDDVAIGDSIAIQGACMTVVAKEAGRFEVELSAESLGCTTGLDRRAPVNLEKALRIGDRLGGHLVSGHVDGVAEVVAVEPVGESRRFDLRVAPALGRYLAAKGSVTVDGVSLTVNQVADGADGIGGTRFSINLIAHTLAVTTLGERRAGDRVNIEVDLIARHVERLLGDAGRSLPEPPPAVMPQQVAPPTTGVER
ncbi:MAG: riboflavin synthase [Burkholderiaceae bacterium]